MYPFFRELLVKSKTQDNLMMAGAEIDVIFDFAINLCSQKYNRKIERCKNLPKCFSLMVTFFYSGFKIYVVFMSQILLLVAKYFIGALQPVSKGTDNIAAMYNWWWTYKRS